MSIGATVSTRTSQYIGLNVGLSVCLTLNAAMGVGMIVSDNTSVGVIARAALSE